MGSDYPNAPPARTNWILARRPHRNPVFPEKPHSFFVESEPDAAGAKVSIATVLLVNKECPWKCLMCDLWKNTLPGKTPAGSIPAQISHALERLPPAPHLKLYNSGSFFDHQAVPAQDYPAILQLLRPFQRVIVESHPLLVRRARNFQEMLGTELEVAMGLEIAHPEIFDRLNKGISLDDYARAALFLQNSRILHRAFVLVKAPFLDESEGAFWTKQSIDFAFQCGADVVSLIPTRAGNGALDALAATGDFSPPSLPTIESVFEYGLQQHKGRVLIDLWEIERFCRCSECGPARINRLRTMNLQQTILPPVPCRGHCPDAEN